MASGVLLLMHTPYSIKVEEDNIKRLLANRIAIADSPNAVWHDHDQMFDEIEAGLK